MRLPVPCSPMPSRSISSTGLRAVREERLPGLVGGRDLLHAVGIPGTAVGLARHVRQGIETIVRPQLDFVHRPCRRRSDAPCENSPSRVEVAVRRAVKLGGVGLERMRAELLDIDDRRPRQPLRPQHVEARRCPVGIGQRRESVFRARLVAGHQRRDGVNGGVGTGEIGNARFCAHLAMYGPT